MYIVGQMLASIAYLLDMIFNILYFLLVIRIILSWFGVNPYNEIVQILYKITEPILAIFRDFGTQEMAENGSKYFPNRSKYLKCPFKWPPNPSRTVHNPS